MHTSPQRILIVRLSHLGDVVCALPVLWAVRRAYPRARIGWVVQPEFSGVLAGRADLDEWIPFDRRAGVSGWARLERDLLRFAADWTIDAQGNLKSALVALTSRAPRRSGLARADWTEPLGACSLHDGATPALRAADGSVHAIDKMLALARHAAPDVPVDPAAPCGLPHRSASSSAARLGRSGRPSAVLHLAAPGDPRSWPVERFEALARDLARDHEVVVVGGPAEVEISGACARRLADVPHVRARIALDGLGALLDLCAEAAAAGGVFVGCDSGPLHVAWSQGLRVVLLAGPQDERRTGPWPPPARSHAPLHEVVRARVAPACAPCLARRCDHSSGNVCMSGIDSTLVAETVRRLTIRSPKAAAAASAP